MAANHSLGHEEVTYKAQARRNIGQGGEVPTKQNILFHPVKNNNNKNQQKQYQEPQ